MEKLRTVTLPVGRQVNVSVTEEHLVGYDVREGTLDDNTPGMVIKAIWNTPDTNGTPRISSRKVSGRLATDILSRIGQEAIIDEIRDETKLQ